MEATNNERVLKVGYQPTDLFHCICCLMTAQKDIGIVQQDDRHGCISLCMSQQMRLNHEQQGCALQMGSLFRCKWFICLPSQKQYVRPGLVGKAISSHVLVRRLLLWELHRIVHIVEMTQSVDVMQVSYHSRYFRDSSIIRFRRFKPAEVMLIDDSRSIRQDSSHVLDSAEVARSQT